MWASEKAVVVEITDARNFDFTGIFYILVWFRATDLKTHSLQFCVTIRARRLALRVNQLKTVARSQF